MNNNKNRRRDRKKNSPEFRKMEPKDYTDAGIEKGKKIGIHESEHEK
jgi:hypothetical protein